MSSWRKGFLLALILPLPFILTPPAHAGYTGVQYGIVNENGSLTLTAPSGAVFTQVVFASYGSPTQTYPYSIGACHAATSSNVVGTAFLNRNSATLGATNGNFTDPCVGTGKQLAVTMGYTYSLTNSSLPTISGSTSVGATLTATQGTWANTPNSYAYQWQRAATSGGTYSDIASANSNTYVITSSDVGKFLKVVVAATNDAGSVSAASLPTASAVSGITSTTLSLSGSPTVAYYRTATPISISVTADGKVSVFANGKIIPGCKNALTSSLAFTCNWKPTTHGSVTLVSTYTPTVAGYQSSTSSSYRIHVIMRTNKR